MTGKHHRRRALRACLFAFALLPAAAVAEPFPPGSKAAKCDFDLADGRDYVTVTLTIDQFDIPDSATDSGGSFELEFGVPVTIRAIPADATPGHGGVLCEIPQVLKYEAEIPDLWMGHVWPYAVNRAFRVLNVPRKSEVEFTLLVNESDSGSGPFNPGERVDIHPAPDKDFVRVYAYPNEGLGITNASPNGQPDLTIGKRKRIEGDGKGLLEVDFGGAIEFTITVMDQPEPEPKSTGQAGAGQKVTDNEQLCRIYALKAVEYNREALALGCGFQPPVWSNDHQMHFDWCMRGGNAAIAEAENTRRIGQLNDCKLAQAPKPAVPAPGNQQGNGECAVYAHEAVTAANAAAALGCGFFGPRWLADYMAHYNFCVAQPGAAILFSEHNARQAELQQCRAAKGQ